MLELTSRASSSDVSSGSVRLASTSTGLPSGCVRPATNEGRANSSSRGAAHLGHWTSARGVETGRIRAAVLDAFARHLAHLCLPPPVSGSGPLPPGGGAPLRDALAARRRRAVIPHPRPNPCRRLVETFSAWMRQHRGVRESTLGNYLPLVQEFLATLGDDAAAYDAARVRAFVLARANRCRTQPGQVGRQCRPDVSALPGGAAATVQPTSPRRFPRSPTGSSPRCLATSWPPTSSGWWRRAIRPPRRARAIAR